MNGMLLAAGHGERMEPLSTFVAKPALEVLGRPLLASALDHLVRAGCRPTVVNLHRHPDQVEAAARAAGGAELRFSREPELLGGAGGVAAARAHFEPGPVLVANADVWADLELAPVIDAVARDTVVLALLPHPDPGRWGSVVLGPAGHVAAFLAPGAAGPDERFLFTGFQALGEEVVRGLPEPPAEMSEVWQALLRRRRLLGVRVQGSWREAGSPGAYRELVAALLGGVSWAGPSARVAPGAEVVASAIGAGCRVAAAAAVRDSVVTAGAIIDAGSRVRRCVVAGDVTVPRGSSHEDALVLPCGSFPLR